MKPYYYNNVPQAVLQENSFWKIVAKDFQNLLTEPKK